MGNSSMNIDSQNKVNSKLGSFFENVQSDSQRIHIITTTLDRGILDVVKGDSNNPANLSQFLTDGLTENLLLEAIKAGLIDLSNNDYNTLDFLKYEEITNEDGETELDVTGINSEYFNIWKQNTKIFKFDLSTQQVSISDEAIQDINDQSTQNVASDNSLETVETPESNDSLITDQDDEIKTITTNNEGNGKSFERMTNTPLVVDKEIRLLILGLPVIKMEKYREFEKIAKSGKSSVFDFKSIFELNQYGIPLVNNTAKTLNKISFMLESKFSSEQMLNYLADYKVHKDPELYMLYLSINAYRSQYKKDIENNLSPITLSGPILNGLYKTFGRIKAHSETSIVDNKTIGSGEDAKRETIASTTNSFKEAYANFRTNWIDKFQIIESDLAVVIDDVKYIDVEKLIKVSRKISLVSEEEDRKLVVKELFSQLGFYLSDVTLNDQKLMPIFIDLLFGFTKISNSKFVNKTENNFLYISLENLYADQSGRIDVIINSNYLYSDLTIPITEQDRKGDLVTYLQLKNNILQSANALNSFITGFKISTSEKDNQTISELTTETIDELIEFKTYLERFNPTTNPDILKSKIWNLLYEKVYDKRGYKTGEYERTKYSIEINTKNGHVDKYVIAGENISKDLSNNQLEKEKYLQIQMRSLFETFNKEIMRTESSSSSWAFKVLDGSNRGIILYQPPSYKEDESFESVELDDRFFNDVFGTYLKDEDGLNIERKEIFKDILLDNINYIKELVTDYNNQKPQDETKKVDHFLKDLLASNNARRLINRIKGTTENPKMDEVIKIYAINDFIYNLEEYLLFHGTFDNIESFKSSFNKRAKSIISGGSNMNLDPLAIDIFNTDKTTLHQVANLGEKQVELPFVVEAKTTVLKDQIITRESGYTDNNGKNLIDRINEDAKQSLKKSAEKSGRFLTENDLKDVLAPMQGYDETTVSDGQGDINFDYYRQLMWSINNWSDEQEIGYKYEVYKYILASDKLRNKIDPYTLNKYREYVEIVDKLRVSNFSDFNGLNLEDKESKRKEWEDLINEMSNLKYVRHGDVVNKYKLSLSKPLEFYFNVIKASYRGSIKDKDGKLQEVFDKFSLVPMIPSQFIGTVSEPLIDKMIQDNISYGKFKTGTKLWSPEQLNLQEILSQNQKDQDVINEKFKSSSYEVQSVLLKEQINTQNFIKLENLFGTQFRFLLLSNIYSDGAILDESFRDDVDKYESAIAQISNLERIKLFDELGVNVKQNVNGELLNLDKNQLYTLVDTLHKLIASNDIELEIIEQEKIINRVIKDLSSRDTQKPLLDIFQRDSNGKLKYNIEAGLSKQVVENLVQGIINNRIVKQKVNGQALIQVTSTLFQPKDEVTTKVKTKINGLSSYVYNENSVDEAEVILAFNGNWLKLGNLYHSDGLKINYSGNYTDTLNRINEMLGDENWVKKNRKSLRIVGYRIPTQGLNSMDVFRVKKFVDGMFGNIIVPPAQITTKSGSDYEINYFHCINPSLDISGKYISPYYKEFDVAITCLSQIRDSIKTDVITNNLLATIFNLSESAFLNNIKDEDLEIVLNKELLSHQVKCEIKKHLRVVNNYKKSLQNQLLESASNILRNPLNYWQLVLPNTTIIIESVINKIGSELPEKLRVIETKRKSQFEIMSIRNQFLARAGMLTGKDLLPIAAVYNKYFQVFLRYNTKFDFGYNPLTGKIFDSVSRLNNKGQLISELFSQFINATVDAASNDFLAKVYFSMDNMAFAMLNIMSGADSEDIVKTIVQPIIFKSKNNNKFSTSYYIKNLIYGVSDERLNQQINNKSDYNRKDDNYSLFVDYLLDNKILISRSSPLYNTKDYFESKGREFAIIRSKEDLEKAIIDIVDNLDNLSFDLNDYKLTFEEIENGAKIDTSLNGEYQNKLLNQILIYNYFQDYKGKSLYLKNSQNKINFDTSKNKNYFDAKIRNEFELASIEVMSKDELTKLKTNSLLASFNTNEITIKVFELLFPITTDESFTERVLNKVESIKKESSRKADKFIIRSKNDFLNAIIQNFGYVTVEVRGSQNRDTEFTFKKITFGELGRNLLDVYGDYKDTLIDRTLFQYLQLKLVATKVDERSDKQDKNTTYNKKLEDLFETNPLLNKIVSFKPRILNSTSIYKNSKNMTLKAIKQLEFLEKELIHDQFSYLLTLDNSYFENEYVTNLFNKFIKNLAYSTIAQSAYNRSNISWQELVPIDMYIEITNNAMETFKSLDESVKNEFVEKFIFLFDRNNKDQFKYLYSDYSIFDDSISKKNQNLLNNNDVVTQGIFHQG